MAAKKKKKALKVAPKIQAAALTPPDLGPKKTCAACGATYMVSAALHAAFCSAGKQTCESCGEAFDPSEPDSGEGVCVVCAEAEPM